MIKCEFNISKTKIIKGLNNINEVVVNFFHLKLNFKTKLFIWIVLLHNYVVNNFMLNVCCIEILWIDTITQ